MAVDALLLQKTAELLGKGKRKGNIKQLSTIYLDYYSILGNISDMFESVFVYNFNGV